MKCRMYDCEEEAEFMIWAPDHEFTNVCTWCYLQIALTATLRGVRVYRWPIKPLERKATE